MNTTDCEHDNRSFASAEQPDARGLRKIRLVCDDCGAQIDMLSLRSDDEIAAAIEAAQ